MGGAGLDEAGIGAGAGEVAGAEVAGLRLLRRLGQGSFGAVWEAEDTFERGHRVALKLLHAELREDAGTVAALEREVRVLRTLQHPRIVQVQRGIFTPTHAGVVTELLRGQDLEARLFGPGAAGGLPVAEALRLLEQALDALAYAHSAGGGRPQVLHRDLKPANLYLAEGGDLKLIDFGVAKAIEGTQGTRTAFKGTFQYAAPEVLEDEPPTPAADLYALGLVGWELLTGRRACAPTAVGAQVRWHAQRAPEPLRALRPDAPAWLEGLLAGLYAKDPGARPADGAVALARMRRLAAEAAAGAGGPSARPAPAASVVLGVGVGAAPRPAAARELPSGTVTRAPLPAQVDAARSEPDEGAARALAERHAEAERAARVEAERAARVEAEQQERAAAAARAQAERAAQEDAERRAAEHAAGRVEAERRPARAAAERRAQAEVAAHPTLEAVPVGHAARGPTRRFVPEAARMERVAGGEPGLVGVTFGDPPYPMVRVPGGAFTMGSGRADAERLNDEVEREVVLTRATWVGLTAVTQALWRRVTGSNPAHAQGQGEALPVESVTWFEALRFANALSALHGLQPVYAGLEGDAAGRPGAITVAWRASGYRLPTEAEWEYAAGAGGRARFAGGDVCEAVAWTRENSGGRPQPVGLKDPNAWGLHDLSGNVWEWCWDWYGPYDPSDRVDPAGPAAGAGRVLRGGSWYRSTRHARVTHRGLTSPGGSAPDVGLRLVRTVG